MESTNYVKFTHKISKGSNFNQIYVPREVESDFEVGDIVEVRLIEKRIKVYFSKNIKKLSDFKKRLILDIFGFLNRFREIKQVFIVGSFLFEKVDYRDIDLVLVARKENEKRLDKVYDALAEEFNLKFHVIIFPEEKFGRLLEIDPLTRSMFFYYISSKDFKLPAERIIDKNHIQFILMLPEDVLGLDVESRMFYDSLRRVLTIEQFLKKSNEDPVFINRKLQSLLGNYLFMRLKNNKRAGEPIVKKLRKIIKKKIHEIYLILKEE